MIYVHTRYADDFSNVLCGPSANTSHGVQHLKSKLTHSILFHSK